MDAFPRGRFCWHELSTTDTAAAKAFYPRITGWTPQVWPEDPAYTVWVNGETQVGGLMEGSGNANWLPYVAVQDAEATTFRAEALGAVIVRPTVQVPSVGRIAVLEDPQGATFAILEPEGEAPGHDGVPEVGEFSWHELATTDYDAAMSFYSALFGWQRGAAMDMGPLGMYQIYSRAGRDLGGIYNKPPEMPAPPQWLCYVKVKNVGAAANLARQTGGQVLNGPMEVPGGDLIAQLADPQGAPFAVHEVTVKAAAPAPPAAPKPARREPAAPPAAPAARKPAAGKPATAKPAAKKPVKKKAARNKKR